MRRKLHPALTATKYETETGKYPYEIPRYGGKFSRTSFQKVMYCPYNGWSSPNLFVISTTATDGSLLAPAKISAALPGANLGKKKMILTTAKKTVR